MTARAQVQLFGKLPSHGDFVARGLDGATRNALDAWLSASLAAAQVEFGDTFAARFDAAVPWRFHASGRAGAIAASTDTTGRRFPLMLSRDVDPAAASASAAACETLLYDAIVGGGPPTR